MKRLTVHQLNKKHIKLVWGFRALALGVIVALVSIWLLVYGNPGLV